MFKRSMLSVALVATVVCQSLQAAEASDVIRAVAYHPSGSQYTVNDVVEAASEAAVGAVEVAGEAVQAAVSSDAVVSYVDSAKQSVKNSCATISANASVLAGFTRAVFSPSNHMRAFAAINEAHKTNGFKAACGEFFNNKSTVVATGLTLTAVAAACFAAYKCFSKSNERVEKLDDSSFVEILNS